MFFSLRPWFIWGVSTTLINIIAFVIFLLYFYKRIRFCFYEKYILFLVVFFLVLLWNFYIKSQIGKPSIIFLIILLLTDTEKQKLINWWTISFSLVLLITLIAWLLSWTGALPSYGVVEADDSHNHTYINYLYCLQGFTYTYRFHSIFLEPGHVAMVSAFTIYIKRFDFKNPFVILLFVCTLFTLSLAGFLLLGFGFFLIKMQDGSVWIMLKRSIYILLLFLVLFNVGKIYNGGNNYFNEFILERLEYDEEKGFSGNNRTSDQTDALFKRSIDSGNVYWGMDDNKYRRLRSGDIIHGAGYKIYILQKGIAGLILVFLFYFLLLLTSKNRKFSLGLFILYTFAFIQRAYPFWFSLFSLFLFTTGLFEDSANKVGKLTKRIKNTW